MNLEDLLESHIDRNFHSLATEKAYRTAINVFVKDTEIRDLNISISDVESWKDCVLKRASGSTWNNYLRHLKSLFASAVRKKLISNSKNPFKDIRPVIRPRERKKVCEISEVSRAIQLCEDNSTRFFPNWFRIATIRTLYYTGMRARQLVGLTWKDIDFDKKIIRLSGSHSKTRKEWNIPMTHDIWDVLRGVLNKARKIKSSHASAQVFNITLYSDRHVGDRMTVEQLTAMFRPFRRDGIKISPHKLRHTMATEICNQVEDEGEASVRLRILQEQLGHSSIATTAKYMKPSLKAQAAMICLLKRV